MIDRIVTNIQKWFEVNGKNCKAVLGISGGKDSTITAALLVKALGKDRVLGVLMPNGIQHDISDSQQVVKFLGIESKTVNILDMYEAFVKNLEKEGLSISTDTKINLPPRIRMSVLYAIAQSVNGRVINTCNKSEDFVGYSTKYGDSAGDMSVLGNYFVSEILEIGDKLGLPYDLVHKTPSDGLCGKSDEDRFGFTYDDIEAYIKNGTCGNIKIDKKIKYMHDTSRHKYIEMYVC
jgi:NAD+ synthase